jgi:mono/diheme cytochrome c family protein
VVLGLSTGQELGLAGIAAAFILFAVASAFLLPARDPTFPGRRLGLFVAVTALFLVAMIAAIVVLAREPEEGGGHEGTPAGETTTQGETEPQPAETQETETQAEVQGDPAAGEEAFASAQCGSCHTLSAAGASGTIGPNLDDLKPEYDPIVEQVMNGGGGMPAFKDQLSEQQIQDVAAFVFTSTR